MDGLRFKAVTGGFNALLLSVIAYFLNLLIQDFRKLNKELSKLKELSRADTDEKLATAHP